MLCAKSVESVLVLSALLATFSLNISQQLNEASGFSIANLRLTGPSLRNAAGEKIDSVEVGQQAVISIDIHNNLAQKQDFVILLEVRDGYGVTRYLAWQSGSLLANGNSTMQASWTPADDCFLQSDKDCADNYEIRSFALTSLVNPQVLSAVSATSGISVLGLPPNPPLDQHQYRLTLDDGRIYTIDYSFSKGNGRLSQFQTDRQTSSIQLEVVVSEDCRFTLSMPLFLYNYLFVNNAGNKPVQIGALVDGNDVDYSSFIDNDAGTVTFVFTLEQGANEIEIVGTTLA